LLKFFKVGYTGDQIRRSTIHFNFGRYEAINNYFKGTPSSKIHEKAKMSKVK